MLTTKLLAALGIFGALLVGATTDAFANPWHGPQVVLCPAPVVVARPTPVYVPAPARAPVHLPPPRVVVYSAPVHHPVGWRLPHWHHGRRW